MGLLEKLGVTRGRSKPGSLGAQPVSTGRVVRASYGLKDLVWLLGDVEHGQVLDLGTVRQSTLNFFIERNYKVWTVDLVGEWKQWLAADAARRRRQRRDGEEEEPPDPDWLAQGFLADNLVFPLESFDVVLAWDVFDYVELTAARRIVNRLWEVMRPGGVALTLFHSKLPEGFSRYRIVDPQHIEVIPAPPLLPPVRVLQNREILALFERFHSSKTYVGRDQLREGLFTR
jgi:SAM-dependent methyltransferase